ncbi:MAG: hypothetical protein WAO08_35165 [Hyphomicrobiaceae bacterium]
MVGWFRARSLRRNALKDVKTARNVMGSDARLTVARRVIAQMALIEQQPGRANGAIDLLSAALRQATADKRAAPRGSQRDCDPTRMAAALVESWIGARLAASRRKISMRAYERIDAVIWSFVADTIDPAEIEAAFRRQAP